MKMKSMWSKTLTLSAPSVPAFQAMKSSATLTTGNTPGPILLMDRIMNCDILVSKTVYHENYGDLSYDPEQ